MRSTLLRLTAVAAVLSFAPATAVAAADAHHLSGGGTASISQVAMNVSVNGSGSAEECIDRFAGTNGKNSPLASRSQKSSGCPDHYLGATTRSAAQVHSTRTTRRLPGQPCGTPTRS